MNVCNGDLWNLSKAWSGWHSGERTQFVGWLYSRSYARTTFWFSTSYLFNKFCVAFLAVSLLRPFMKVQNSFFRCRMRWLLCDVHITVICRRELLSVCCAPLVSFDTCAAAASWPLQVSPLPLPLFLVRNRVQSKPFFSHGLFHLSPQVHWPAADSNGYPLRPPRTGPLSCHTCVLWLWEQALQACLLPCAINLIFPSSPGVLHSAFPYQYTSSSFSFLPKLASRNWLWLVFSLQLSFEVWPLLSPPYFSNMSAMLSIKAA